MTRQGYQIVISIFLAIYFAAGQLHAEDKSSERANEILKKIDDLWRGESSHAIMTMQVKTEHYTRTIQMEGWSKGEEKSLIRIVKPLKEKGTATLKSDKNIFSYLPKTDRTIRLTSGMMMGSWMGSHFTNDDLVQESRREDDFISTISFEGERDGQPIIEFSMIPKEDAAVVWGKVVLVVRSTDFIPISEVYYDEDLKVTRTFSFTDLKILAGKMRPAVMQVIPADKPDEYTKVIYESLELDIPMNDSFFSLANLKRSR